MDLRKQLFSSSWSEEPTKRASAEPLEDTPAAKRAKRSKSGKKRRSKEGQGSGADLVQDDWVCFNRSPATGSPVQKITPVYPPTPFPLKQTSKVKVLKSDENYEKTDSEIRMESVESRIDVSGSLEEREIHESPKTEASTSKTRTEREVKRDSLKASTTVEPPKLEAEKKKPSVEPPTSNRITPKADASPKTDGLYKADKAQAHGDEDLNSIMEITSSPRGHKTLRAINKNLKALNAKLGGGGGQSDPELIKELQSLRTDMSSLHHRLHRDALRASFRHEIIFNALKKVSTDINKLSLQLQCENTDHGQNEGAEEAVAATPRSVKGKAHKGSTKDAASKDGSRDTASASSTVAKHSAALEQSRKTLEHCLDGFHEDMKKADSAEEVNRFGRLCVQYAADLFKTLG
ncbi:hypothetical protein MMYC01_204184 [Madurella mycetomatis]|uniref:Uncharacterized protein n=1 Tax=Madurella mycetomatis TaxID=100816 RepID=A0A175W6G6_9PEZI|nr:hypothetical protein MMYC01_204184 [Madurella mycetomatis]